MYVAFALLADAANVAADGKLNILGVFDVLRAASFPAAYPRVHLVARLKAQTADVGARRLALQVTGPGGATLLASEAQVEIPPLPPGVAEIDIPLVQVFDLPIERPGPHAVLLLVDGRVASQLPVTVVGDGAPAGPLIQPPAGTLVS
jgi:hypothetical protein